MASGDQPLPPEWVCASNSVQDGEQPVSSPCSWETQLDGLHRSERCVPSGSGSSGEQEVSSVLGLRKGLSVQGPLLGLSTAPQVFTRVMAPVLSFLHSLGIRIFRYLDDWLILVSSLSEALWARDTVIDLCHQFGIIINLDKSHLTPSRLVTYLGMVLRSSILKVFPAPEQVSVVGQISETIFHFWKQAPKLAHILLRYCSFDKTR